MTHPHATEHRRPAGRLVIAAALLACSALARSAVAPVPGALTRLGGQAIDTFERQLEPAPVQVTLEGWAEREAGVIERAQMRRVFAAAVQALIAQAGDAGANADRVFEIRHALDELARHGRSVAADRLFAAQAEAAQARGEEGRAAAALAWRHSVALSELPVALATRGGRFDSRQVFRGRTFQPLGALALPTLERAAQLDGSDPWAWIMLAWLGSRDAALPAAPEAASGNPDDTTALAAALPLIERWLRQGRGPEAATLQVAILHRLEVAVKRQPTRAADVQTLAFALHRAAEFAKEFGRPQVAWETMHKVLSLREQLAAEAPGDRQPQWDLIATHNTMARMPPEGRAVSHLSSALMLSAALNQRDRFVPMLDGNALIGMANLVIRLSGVLTLLIGAGLLVLYRWRIARWMRAAASAHSVPEPPPAMKLAVPTDASSVPALRPMWRHARSTRTSSWISSADGCAASSSSNRRTCHDASPISICCPTGTAASGSTMWSAATTPGRLRCGR